MTKGRVLHNKTIPAALAAVVLAIALAGCGGSPTPDAPAPSTPAEEAPTQSEAPAEPAAPEMTLEQQNAVAKGEQYLAIMGFSRSGLIAQLEFEGFPVEVATFAVDTIAPDWNAEAAEKAQQYLDTMAFSRQALIDQLVFDGFTPEEAEFGVTQVGL